MRGQVGTQGRKRHCGLRGGQQGDDDVVDEGKNKNKQRERGGPREWMGKGIQG